MFFQEIKIVIFDQFNLSSVNSEIEHTGVVSSIGKNDITVILQDTVSCGSCPAVSFCSTKENGNNIIVIPNGSPGSYTAGERIKVLISTGSRFQAIMTGVVFPCLVLLLTVTGVYVIFENELNAALSGLILTALYYFCLYLKRDKLQKRLDIRVEKMNV